MKNKLLLIILGILLLEILPIINPVGETSYCCEKTIGGVWCQNAPEEQCNEKYQKQPTSCESVSYCKKGCCYDSKEGTCMKNNPKSSCTSEGGTWENKANCKIDQCELGCCLIGDQAAFVSLVRCKRLASVYGLETDFKTNIDSELECIASASSETKGACVFEEEFERTCLFISQKECNGMENGSRQDIKFYPNKLCSAENLNTTCGPTEKTTCVEGKDEIYFIDSCGNLANIYDATKIKDTNYWSDVKGKAESCNYDKSNAGSSSCGNCDYFLGSTCKAYKRGESVKPSYGNNICKDLNCEYEGKTYQHGETWCANAKGIKSNSPGSRYSRLVCYNNEVTIEPCADYRQEICLQSNIGNFKTAACRVNRWQDCTSQSSQKNCENSDKRDCKWISGRNNNDKVCVPLYSPGFDFWNTGGSASDSCSKASVSCTATFKKKFESMVKWSKETTCKHGCECIDTDGDVRQEWVDKMAAQCTALGDCGSKVNYLGQQGYNENYVTEVGDEESSSE